jgi:nucleoside-diphosphate-sugar epimerase
MKKHILITGATGLIGKKLIKALQEKGHTISGMYTNNRLILRAFMELTL